MVKIQWCDPGLKVNESGLWLYRMAIPPTEFASLPRVEATRRTREAVTLPPGWRWTGGGPGTSELTAEARVLDADGRLVGDRELIPMAIDAARAAGQDDLVDFLGSL